MTTVPELSPIEEEAAMWLVDADRGLSDREAAQFDAWLATSEEHALAWARASRMWNSVDVSDELVAAMRMDALTTRPSRRGFVAGAKAAALTAALAIVGVAGWQAIYAPKEAAAPVVIARNVEPTFVTGPGAKRSTALPDGTRVELEENTAISLAFTPGRRDLRLLRGQARFDVQHDLKRPFAVQAADAMVTATGTRFTVRVLQSGLVATLDRGTVVVSRHPDEAQLVLRPGEQVTAVQGFPLSVSSAQSPDSLARQGGYLEFNETPIGEAVAQVNRFGDGARIEVSPNASGLRISGRFQLGDVKGFVSAVTEVLPLRRSQVAGSVIRLSRY